MRRCEEAAGQKEAPAGGASQAIAEVFAEAIRIAMLNEGEERALLDDLQRELRGFVSTYDGHPEWLWAPATVRFVRAVRPKLELLGGPVGAADAGVPLDEWQGEAPGPDAA